MMVIGKGLSGGLYPISGRGHDARAVGWFLTSKGGRTVDLRRLRARLPRRLESLGDLAATRGLSPTPDASPTISARDWARSARVIRSSPASAARVWSWACSSADSTGGAAPLLGPLPPRRVGDVLRGTTSPCSSSSPACCVDEALLRRSSSPASRPPSARSSATPRRARAPVHERLQHPRQRAPDRAAPRAGDQGDLAAGISPGPASSCSSTARTPSSPSPLRTRSSASCASTARAIAATRNIRSELAWMKDLLARRCAHPAGAADEGRRRTGGGRHATACPNRASATFSPGSKASRWARSRRGVDLGEETLRHSYRTVGEIAARIHAHGASWKRPPGFARRAWDLESLIGDDPAFGRFWELELRHRRAARPALPRPRSRPRGTREVAVDERSLRPHARRSGSRQHPRRRRRDPRRRLRRLRLTPGTPSSLRPRSSRCSAARPSSRRVQAYLEGYRARAALPRRAARGDAFDCSMARGLSYLGWPVGRSEMQSGRVT